MRPHPSRLHVPHLAQQVARHQPAAADRAWAAVALVLAEGDAGAELLMIRRVAREGDRWSGDMALPGGKQEPGDTSVVHTAARETWEETRVSVVDHVGRLDDVVGRPSSHRIATAVFTLDELTVPIPEPSEVAEAVWLPVAALADPANHGWYRYKGVVPFPSITVEGYMIWGLTHRILTHFMAVAGIS